MQLEFNEPKKAKMIKANRVLQAKIGMGPLDKNALRRSEEVMLNANLDFGPLAHEYLVKLNAIIRKTRANEIKHRAAIEAMCEPVMQLKAHAGMFRYPLISKLAHIMLGFLETIDHMDEAALDIIDVHHNTLKIIVSKKMEGEGGTYGEQLQAELKEACVRYFARLSRL